MIYYLSSRELLKVFEKRTSVIRTVIREAQPLIVCPQDCSSRRVGEMQGRGYHSSQERKG